MINPPKRWPDSVDAPPRIGELLRRAAPPTAIPDAVRARSLARVMKGLQGAEPREARLAVRSPPLVVALAMISAGALASQAGGHLVRRGTAAPGGAVRSGAADVALARSADARPAEPLVVPAPTKSTPLTSGAPEPAPAAPPSGHVARAFQAPRVEAARARADTLLAESQLLESARRSLETSPARAMVILDGYRARYPAGQLADEGEFLAIRALMALGRADQAADRLHQLQARSGGSLYATELQKLMDQRSFEGTARP